MDISNYVNAFSWAVKKKVLECERTAFKPIRSKLMEGLEKTNMIYVDGLESKVNTLSTRLMESPLDGLESLGTALGSILAPVNLLMKLAVGALFLVTFQHDHMVSIFGLEKATGASMDVAGPSNKTETAEDVKNFEEANKNSADNGGEEDGENSENQA